MSVGLATSSRKRQIPARRSEPRASCRKRFTRSAHSSGGQRLVIHEGDPEGAADRPAVTWFCSSLCSLVFPFLAPWTRFFPSDVSLRGLSARRVSLSTVAVRVPWKPTAPLAVRGSAEEEQEGKGSGPRACPATSSFSGVFSCLSGSLEERLGAREPGSLRSRPRAGLATEFPAPGSVSASAPVAGKGGLGSLPRDCAPGVAMSGHLGLGACLEISCPTHEPPGRVPRALLPLPVQVCHFFLFFEG